MIKTSPKKVKRDLLKFIDRLPNNVADPATRFFFTRLGVSVVQLGLINKIFYIGDYAAIAQHLNVKFEYQAVDPAVMQRLFNNAFGTKAEFVVGYFKFSKRGSDTIPKYQCEIHIDNWRSLVEFMDPEQTSQPKGDLLCTT